MSDRSVLTPESLAAWRGRRVLVVGDAILDRYCHGTVSRISPEAPVPVVRWHSEEARLGGAANVVANLVSLGARPVLVAVTGEDDDAARVRELLEESGVAVDDLVEVSGRPTSVKTRILAKHQQVVRLDREESDPVGDEVAGEVLARALSRLDDADALIVSDYAKGLLDERILPELLQAARDREVVTVVDPKIRNFPLYTPATVVTPNRSEALRATAREIEHDEELAGVGREILSRLDLRAVLITLGEEGMLLVAREGAPVRIPAEAREVFDVTGAGDTVAATLALAACAGADLETAARWANAAAALAVGHLGTAAIGLEELSDHVRGPRP